MSNIEKVQSSLPAEFDPEVANALAQMAGAGFDNTTKDDYALPFLHILQKMSPQVDKRDPKYVKGAEEGQFFNTVTQEAFEGENTGIVVIPVDFKKVFLEWVPRTLGGGLVAEHATREEAELNRSTEKQTDIVDTANHYLLIRTANGWEAAVFSCTSTKLKASRAWMSMMSRVTVNGKPAPSFAKKYVLRTVSQSNDKGSYFNFKADPIEGPDGWVTKEELQEAMTFFKQIRAGEKKIDFSTHEAAQSSAPVGMEDGEDDIAF